MKRKWPYDNRVILKVRQNTLYFDAQAYGKQEQAVGSIKNGWHAFDGWSMNGNWNVNVFPRWRGGKWHSYFFQRRNPHMTHLATVSDGSCMINPAALSSYISIAQKTFGPKRWWRRQAIARMRPSTAASTAGRMPQRLVLVAFMGCLLMIIPCFFVAVWKPKLDPLSSRKPNSLNSYVIVWSSRREFCGQQTVLDSIISSLRFSKSAAIRDDQHKNTSRPREFQHLRSVRWVDFPCSSCSCGTSSDSHLSLKLQHALWNAEAIQQSL